METNVELIRASYSAVLKNHPIILAKAVLPSPPIREVTQLVVSRARRNRRSLAFWAHPLAGKSSCIAALRNILPSHFRGCAIVLYEPSSKDTIAEGTLIEDILSSIDYAPKIQRTLAGKRDQLLRSLFVMASEGRHLFLIIDEAQNLMAKELGWLKRIVNWLIARQLKVTVVLFGQSELKSLHTTMQTAHSDLVARFMSEFIEFRNLESAEDLRVTLAACDELSEFPLGSGWSYTEYLWPEAFASGFRLADCADVLFEEFRALAGSENTGEGIGIQWISEVLALVGEVAAKSDGPKFSIGKEAWAAAIRESGFLRRVPIASSQSAPEKR